jgi:hypothetical protein
VSFLREPDALTAPVRFDEREQETGPSQTGLRGCGESFITSPPGDYRYCACSRLYYFNYYAVPGNVGSLSLFRDRLLGLWWNTLCRRSQQRLPWKKMLRLGDRWLARPRVLHPYPEVRFSASHPR